MVQSIRRFALVVLCLLALPVLPTLPAVTAQTPAPVTAGVAPPPFAPAPPAGPRPALGSGRLYLTSLDLGDHTFAVYYPALDSWTNLTPYDTSCQMAVSASGQLYAYGRATGTIDLYDPVTDTWSAVLIAPPGTTGFQCNLEVTDAGEFLYTEWEGTELWYTSGGVWNSMELPFVGNAMGDYDPTADQYVVGEAWTSDAHLIDVHTWTITDYLSAVPNGEISRFSSVLDGRYFFQVEDSTIHSFDLGNPALPPFDHGVGGLWFASSAADRATHQIYAADIDGDPLWVFDPAAGTLTPLTAHGGTWHSSVAFVPSAAGPDIVVSPASLHAQQCPGTVTEKTLQICNVGDAELIWSLTEVPGRRTPRAVLPEPAPAAPSDLDRGPAPASPEPHLTGGPEVLIVQDEDPWGYTSIKDVLEANGIAYDLVGSAQIPTVDLSPYGLVIVPSLQSADFYTIWNANVVRFEEYVEGGGALWLSTCAYPWTTPEPLLPGGVINHNDMENYNPIVEPGHPWVAGVPDPIYGTWASHDSFTNLSAGSIVVAQAQNTGQATLVDYMLGSGRMLITGQTLEYAWYTGEDYGLILQNSLLDMVDWEPADVVPWLDADPTAGGLNPGGCGEVAVTFDSTGLEAGTYSAHLQIDSNDPDQPQVGVPVTLTVHPCTEPMVFATHVRILALPSYPLLLGIVRTATGNGWTPVPGAQVDVTWTIPPGGGMIIPQTRVSKASGLAFPVMLRTWTGRYVLEVTNITAAGYLYDPNLNWESSATIIWP